MASALTSQLTRFTDRCNKVLAGGTVKTFEPNSLIPKITYQDPNKEIPNLEEVILDETGRAKIYISGNYRIQVYSRDGILIEDNLFVEQTLVQRDFTELSQEIHVELQQALDQFQIESTAAVDNLYAAITSIGGMVVDGQFKLDWTHVFNKPTTVGGYGITDAYTKSEANSAFIEDSEKGAAGGVATLAANSKILVAQLPTATETTIGAAEIATTAIAKAGINDANFITAKKLWDALNAPSGFPVSALLSFGYVTTSGSTATLRRGSNIASVSRLGSAGLYAVAFSKPMPDTNYLVLLGLEGDGGQDYIKQSPKSSKTVNGFNIQVFQSSGGSDGANFSFGVTY